MVMNLFKQRPADDPIEDLIRTSATPPTIPQLLADASARFGDKIAYQEKVQGTWRTLSFEAAWRRSNDFAAGLIALGLQRGDRVAIICENGVDWAVAYFGTSIAGGVGVPLYTELKADEIAELVDRSGARMIVVSNRVLEQLDGHLPNTEQVIVIDGAEATPGKTPRFLRRGQPGRLPFDQVAAQATESSRAELAGRRVETDDLASIIFTSGTTGGMKGVMLTHKNLTSNVESIRRAFQLDDKDRIVLVLPMHHAFPFILFLSSCSLGGEMTFENDLLRVRDRMKETKPTLFFGVPALFEQLYRTILRRAEAEGRMELFQRGLRLVELIKRRTGVNLGRRVFDQVHQQLGGQLRWVFSGGAALNPEITRQFHRLGIPLLQGWGLTEASPGITIQRWQPRKFLFGNYYEEKMGTVGRAMDGIEVKLIDVPEKEIYVHLHGEGELIVRGPNVFAGYWQSPEETAKAMVGDWLRTGDLGHFDEEGNIWITGRSKYVIVLESGEKVVPDELEERLWESELIGDICVLERQNRNKTQVGAVIYPNREAVLAALKERGEDVTETSVRKVLQDELDASAKKLAPYKRISELLITDSPLPKTGLLKIARGKLPESYSFDLKRWEETALEQAAAAPDQSTPASDDSDIAAEA